MYKFILTKIRWLIKFEKNNSLCWEFKIHSLESDSLNDKSFEKVNNITIFQPFSCQIQDSWSILLDKVGILTYQSVWSRWAWKLNTLNYVAFWKF